MRRREFSRAAAVVAGFALVTGSTAPQGKVATRSAKSLKRAPPVAASAAPAVLGMGTNLSGMEWAKPGLRYGGSTAPNLHFTVPRKADVAYLASEGFTKNRLPIQWELLQPMLHDTVADAAAVALIGMPGAFHAAYEAYIAGVLDAHAAAGIRCIVDVHNYCRYQDFVFQADGSVRGLTRAPSALTRPYTQDNSQVQERIFATAAGATLRQSHFCDLWSRMATRWARHPGFGGYGLMNEPHDMPRPGGTTASSGGEDLTIWPVFAQAAIDAIRAIDPAGPIYVAGNAWNSAMSIGSLNPAWPLAGDNLIYEVHMYLDAASNGYAFDYDSEVAKGFSAGGSGPIHMNTGLERLKIATDWAKARNLRLALTEVGMPIDDPRWQEMFERAVVHARRHGCEIYSWMGGSHWPIRNYPINHVPGWHQNKTLEPAVSGPMKAAAGLGRSATLFDDGPGWAAGGGSVDITVYARGYLPGPVIVDVGSDNGGSFSKTRLILPAGANSSDVFRFTPGADRVTSLSYRRRGQPQGQVPPPRRVFSLLDPVAHARVDLAAAAGALLARYGASKWEMADGHTDFLHGQPSRDGQAIRAISDSGYGSGMGNAMEMLNWVNQDSTAMGSMAVPVMRTARGRKCSDHSQQDTWGFWCKKATPMPGIQANPKNRVPYDIEDAHFVIAAVAVPGPGNSGIVFQASKAEEDHSAELALVNNQPYAKWRDARGRQTELRSPTPLKPGVPAVLALTSRPGAQSLRADSVVVASAGATFAPSVCTQMLIGWGFLNHYPRDGFRGSVYAVVTGKGVPTPAELAVLERYLGNKAGAA